MKALGVLLFSLVSMVSAYNYPSQQQHPSEVNSFRGYRVRTYTSQGQLLNGTRTFTLRKPGRHVCTLVKSYSEPMMVKETYIKPDTSQCNPKVCSTARMVYASRFVPKHRIVKKEAYGCCPGWSHVNHRKRDCNQAVCGEGCHNGGACSKPDVCSCTRGFNGVHCETDVDECLTKPCDHTCVNTRGTYHCTCDDGFTLQRDGLTCRSEEDVCGQGCHNGGSCLKPDVCSCTRGFTGDHCETDVDECLTKPCDHTCVNTWGSYHCMCNDGFTLQEDGLTCRSEEVKDDVELTDLNGYDVNYYCTNAVMSERLSDCTNKKLHQISDKLQNIIQTMSFMTKEFQSFRSIQNDHHYWILEAGKIMEQVNPLSFRIQYLENKLENCDSCSGKESNSASSWEKSSGPKEEARSRNPISSGSKEVRNRNAISSGSKEATSKNLISNGSKEESGSSGSKEPPRKPDGNNSDMVIKDNDHSEGTSSLELNIGVEDNTNSRTDNDAKETKQNKNKNNEVDDESKDTTTTTGDSWW